MSQDWLEIYFKVIDDGDGSEGVARNEDCPAEILKACLEELEVTIWKYMLSSCWCSLWYENIYFVRSFLSFFHFFPAIRRVFEASFKKNLLVFVFVFVCFFVFNLITQDHFAHEEDLLKSYRFGEGGTSSPKQRRVLGGPGALSVQEGHAADHARILALARNELEAAEAKAKAKAADSSGSAASPSAVAQNGLRVRASVCRQVAAAFVTHAELFDALYETHIPVTAL